MLSLYDEKQTTITKTDTRTYGDNRHCKTKTDITMTVRNEKAIRMSFVIRDEQCVEI